MRLYYVAYIARRAGDTVISALSMDWPREIDSFAEAGRVAQFIGTVIGKPDVTVLSWQPIQPAFPATSGEGAEGSD